MGTRRRCAALLLAGALLPAGAAPAGAPAYVALPGGALRTVLPPDGVAAPAQVARYALRANLVSNAEFRTFLHSHPEWLPGRPPTVLAGPGYLVSWNDALDPRAPVTQVSWHAAAAFCASEGARLPRWYEWEFAAAADATRADARDDPAWLEHILSWYERPASSLPPRLGQSPANVYGVHDLHGIGWEWVEDFNGLFVNADGRVKGEQQQLDYCGGAAISLADRRNYAVLMRLAMLAALDANQHGGHLGFRCARDGAAPPEPSR